MQGGDFIDKRRSPRSPLQWIGMAGSMAVAGRAQRRLRCQRSIQMQRRVFIHDFSTQFVSALLLPFVNTQPFSRLIYLYFVSFVNHNIFTTNKTHREEQLGAFLDEAARSYEQIETSSAYQKNYRLLIQAIQKTLEPQLVDIQSQQLNIEQLSSELLYAEMDRRYRDSCKRLRQLFSELYRYLDPKVAQSQLVSFSSMLPHHAQDAIIKSANALVKYVLFLDWDMTLFFSKQAIECLGFYCLEYVFSKIQDSILSYLEQLKTKFGDQLLIVIQTARTADVSPLEIDVSRYCYVHYGANFPKLYWCRRLLEGLKKRGIDAQGLMVDDSLTEKNLFDLDALLGGDASLSFKSVDESYYDLIVLTTRTDLTAYFQSPTSLFGLRPSSRRDNIFNMISSGLQKV